MTTTNDALIAHNAALQAQCAFNDILRTVERMNSPQDRIMVYKALMLDIAYARDNVARAVVCIILERNKVG